MIATRLPTGSHVILSDGSVVHGHPHDTEEYQDCAESLGYTRFGTLEMCQDHDLLHAKLCEWIGLGDSPALLCALGKRQEDEISRAEEAAVLAVQRFVRLSGGTVP